MTGQENTSPIAQVPLRRSSRCDCPSPDAPAQPAPDAESGTSDRRLPCALIRLAAPLSDGLLSDGQHRLSGGSGRRTARGRAHRASPADQRAGGPIATARLLAMEEEHREVIPVV